MKQLNFLINYADNINQKVSITGINENASLQTNSSRSFVKMLPDDGFSSIATITLTTLNTYYYNVEPKITINAADFNSYKIQESKKVVDGLVFSKTFVIKYRPTNPVNFGSVNISYAIKQSDLSFSDVNEITAAIENDEDITVIEKNIVNRKQVQQEEKAKSAINININNVSFNISDMPSEGATRNFKAIGDANARYNLIITILDGTGVGKTYNPDASAFQSGNYKIVNAQANESVPIVFPRTTVFAKYEVEFIPVSSNYTGQRIYNINQDEPVFAEFGLKSAEYPTIYSTDPPGLGVRLENKEKIQLLSWDITLGSRQFLKKYKEGTFSETEALSSLFRVDREIKTNDPQDVHANTTTIALDTVDMLSVGDIVTGSSPFSSSSGTQYITSINKIKNTITVSNAQNLNDNQVLIFTSSLNGADAVAAIAGGSFNMKLQLDITPITTATDNTSTAEKTINVASTIGALPAVTQTVDDTSATNKTNWVLDSVANLFPGMSLIKASSSTLVNVGVKFPEGVQILNVDSTSKTVKLSVQQTLADGETLTFGRTAVKGIGATGYPYVSTVSTGASVVIEPDNQTFENGTDLVFFKVSRSATLKLKITDLIPSKYPYKAYVLLDQLLEVVADS